MRIESYLASVIKGCLLMGVFILSRLLYDHRVIQRIILIHILLLQLLSR